MQHGYPSVGPLRKLARRPSEDIDLKIPAFLLCQWREVGGPIDFATKPMAPHVKILFLYRVFAGTANNLAKRKFRPFDLVFNFSQNHKQVKFALAWSNFSR
jgi:hypothetical protein